MVGTDLAKIDMMAKQTKLGIAVILKLSVTYIIWMNIYLAGTGRSHISEVNIYFSTWLN